MEAEVTQDMKISLPKSDVRLLKEIARRMGWSLEMQKTKSAFQQSMEEADRGEYTEYASVEDFAAKVLGTHGV